MSKIEKNKYVCPICGSKLIYEKELSLYERRIVNPRTGKFQKKVEKELIDTSDNVTHLAYFCTNNECGYNTYDYECGYKVSTKEMRELIKDLNEINKELL